MASEPALRWETLDDGLLRAIYDSDQAMYPDPALTYRRLQSWAAACPALSLCLRSGRAAPSSAAAAAAPPAVVHGCIIVLPLRQACWDQLRRAELSEHDVDAAGMFPPVGRGRGDPPDGGQRTPVGLHVFHIERLPGFATGREKEVPGFAAAALEEIRSRVAKEFGSWDVVGYSALTATKQGSAAFKRLGFTASVATEGTDSLLSDQAEMVCRKGNTSFSVNPSASSS